MEAVRLDLCLLAPPPLLDNQLLLYYTIGLLVSSWIAETLCFHKPGPPSLPGCMYMYAFVLRVCTCACGGQRVTMDVFLSSSPPCILRWGPELTNLARLAGQQAPGICLSMLPPALG